MQNEPNAFDEIRRRLLEIVNAPNYRPQKPKGLLRLMGFAPEDKSVLRRIVRKMVAAGELAYGESHLIRPVVGPKKARSEGSEPATSRVSDSAKPKHERLKKERLKKERRSQEDIPFSEHWIVGSFRRTGSGVGFVTVRDQDRNSEEPTPDIYISSHLTLDAMTGDVVAVELFARKEPKIRRRGREFLRKDTDEERGPRGKVVKILERSSERFVGTYFEDGDWGYVQVDGNIFNQPILVGDPSANSAQPDDKVVIEMLRFPTHYRNGEAVLVEVLGPHGTPGLDTLLIMREYGLPDQFSEAALKAARDEVVLFFNALPDEDGDAAAAPSDAEAKAALRKYLDSVDRTDLTEETIITIDPIDARDFDDAVSLERLENGHWLLGVHIADVSHFVKEGSPVDRDAQDRGTSVYLPDRVIPMLPEVLSNSLASLQPNKVRFTKSVFMEMTAEGVRCNTEIRKSAIRSTARLNYDEVQEYWERGQRTEDRGQEEGTNALHSSEEGAVEQYSKKTESSQSDSLLLTTCPLSSVLCPLLNNMFELAMILRERRMTRGSLEMNMPEIKIDLDKDGRVAGAHAEIQTESHQVIEEFMLAANDAVAEFFAAKEIAFLHRVHKSPTYRKLKQFTDFLRQIRLDDVSPETLSENRFAIQDILEKIKGKPEETAVHFSLLRAMQRAIYTPEEEGHYALASPCYCHFTSPIRRYPDLSVHRTLDVYLSGKKPKTDMNELYLLGLHCSERERRAEDAERELIKLKLIDYMSRNIGMRLHAVVSGLNPSGVFVQGVEIPAEGLIPLVSLDDDDYRFDRRDRTIMGRRSGREFRLGDRLEVEVVRTDLDARTIDFRIVKDQEQPAPKKTTTKK